MSSNPEITVRLKYQQWNALLDAITQGSLAKIGGAQDALNSIQSQILRIKQPDSEIQHYAQPKWIGKVVFKQRKTYRQPVRSIIRVCGCGWSDEVNILKKKCPECGKRFT